MDHGQRAGRLDNPQREHWEEGLPGLYDYEIEELPMYEPDQPSKLRRMSELLSEADYMTLYSNRLYGTVARLPERYPVSREYYRQLFSGGIGYTLDAQLHVVSQPVRRRVCGRDVSRGPTCRLRADCPRRDRILSRSTSDTPTMSFSVYDHPKALVFRNVERLDPDEIMRRIVEGSVRLPCRQSCWLLGGSRIGTRAYAHAARGREPSGRRHLETDR